MRVIVKRDKLIQIIKRTFTYYSNEQIDKIIDEYGADYFNEYSDLNIEYVKYGEWKITI